MAKASFLCLVTKVMEKFLDRFTWVQSNALTALYKANKDNLASFLQDTMVFHAHAKLVTLKLVAMA